MSCYYFLTVILLLSWIIVQIVFSIDLRRVKTHRLGIVRWSERVREWRGGGFEQARPDK